MSRPHRDVLVHIAAPSKASDDARYRALAQAYSGFRPARRLEIATTPHHSSSSSRQGHRQPGGTEPHASGRTIEFPSLSFEGVWDNAGSPDAAGISNWRSGLSGVAEEGLRPGPVAVSERAPALPKKRQPYVSLSDVIPDSQPEDEKRAARRSVSRNDLERSLYVLDNSYISESQGSVCMTQDGDYGLPQMEIQEASSPDLSVLRSEKPKQAASRSQSQSSLHRAPLSQRDANSQQSSQQSSQQDNDSQPKEGIPLWDEEAISLSSVSFPTVNLLPSSLLCSSARSDTIPSSLPEEAGRVVILIEDSSCESQESQSGVDSEVPRLLRAESVPTGTKRRRESGGDHEGWKKATVDAVGRYVITRSASDIGPQQKKQRTAAQFPSSPTRPGGHGKLLGSIAVADSPGSSLPTAVKVGADTSSMERIQMESLPSFPTSSPTAPSSALSRSGSDASLRILSPAPPVSCDHLDAASLVTDKLAKLACDLDLARRYRPATGSPSGTSPGSRAVQPFERGFWRLNTSGWPVALRHQAWAYLAEYVGRGDAGWAVWCSRDPAPHACLRLHCFAAVAGHTYLLLYLASRRQILATGAEWLDGSCTPTITVPPRRRREQSEVDVFARGS